MRLEAVVIGGAALNLLGVIRRRTRDCDLLRPILDQQLASAARAFAAERRDMGDPLADDWLNNGPASLADVLPSGWEARLRPVYGGVALVLQTLGRADLLKSKLFALCDRQLDLQDCLALAPTASELEEALPWVEYQDATPMWPEHVRRSLRDLARRLGHGL